MQTGNDNKRIQTLDHRWKFAYGTFKQIIDKWLINKKYWKSVNNS